MSKTLPTLYNCIYSDKLLSDYRSQFHQRFTHAFLYKIFGAKISNPKHSFVVFVAKILYKKRARKMLMKLTPGRPRCSHLFMFNFAHTILNQMFAFSLCCFSYYWSYYLKKNMPTYYKNEWCNRQK